MFTFPVVRKLYRYTIGPDGPVRSVINQSIKLMNERLVSHVGGHPGYKLQTELTAVGTYKGEPGGAKFYNIKSTITLTLKLILNPRSPYLHNLDPPYMCHEAH